MIFVTGATGFIGRHLVQRLLDAGHPVRVFVSPRASRRLPSWSSHPNVSVVTGLLSDDEALYRALTDVHVIFHFENAQWWGRQRDLERVEMVGLRHLAATARAARVGRIIVLSHLGASVSSAYPLLNVKGQVEDAIKASGLAYTIIRTGLVFGPEDSFMNNIAMLLSINPVFLMPGRGEIVLHPIYIDDLTAALVAALERVDTVDVTVEIGGAEYTTLRDLVLTIMRVTGQRRLILPLPPYLLRFLSRVYSRILPRALTTPQWFDLLATNRTARLATLYEVFGVRARRLEDTLAGYMPKRRYFFRALGYAVRYRPRES